jgi:branched-chain amino acid transport system substrate-binding protein
MSFVTVSRRLAIAGIAAVAFAAAPALAQSGAPIRIGSFLAVTGPASFLGDPEAKTLKLYVEKINQDGGVLGRKLALTVYDSGGDAKQANSFAKRLIDEDKVDLLIGGSTTAETMAVVPVVQDAEIPFVSLAGANVIVEPVRKWVFKTPHSDRMAIEKIFTDLKKRGLAKVGLIGGQGGFDASCRAEAVKAQAAFGIELVGNEAYAQSDTDMTPQLTRLRGAPGIQALVSCGFGAQPVITVRNYKQLGMTNLPFYFSHGVASDQFIKGAEGAAEGIRVPVAAMLVADQLPDGDPQKKIALAYRQAYTTATGDSVSTFGGHAYDALLITVDALKRAKSADKAKLRDAIETTKNLVGVDGIFTMGPGDHMGLDLRSFKMAEIRNGKWTLLP